MGRERQRTSLPDGITVRSAKSIQISFEFRGVRCRETIKLAPTPANIKRVGNHRAAILDAIARNTFDYAITFPESPRARQFADFKGHGYLLKEYLPAWLESRKARFKASTHADYDRTIRKFLVPHFGHTALPDLKIYQVREWCDGQTCSLKTIVNRLMVLRAALQDAVNDELIPANPISEWIYERHEPPKESDDVDPLDAGEIRKVLAACKHEQHRNLFEFAFWTGMRTSELVAITWGDIDWNRKTVRVMRARTRAADEAETPKTKKGAREIVLLTPALAALERQKQWSLLADKEIFLNPHTGTAWNNDQKIRLAWVSALKGAGIRYRRPYQTRHTFASMMLTAGENPAWIAAQLGHSDLTMLIRVYGRWITSAVPDAGHKAVALFCDPVVTQQGQSGHISGHKKKATSK